MVTNYALLMRWINQLEDLAKHGDGKAKRMLTDYKRMPTNKFMAKYGNYYTKKRFD